MLKKPIKPVKVPIKFPEQQAPPTAKDYAKSGDQPPDPIDPGRKEPIPTDADPVGKPVQPAALYNLWFYLDEKFGLVSVECC